MEPGSSDPSDTSLRRSERLAKKPRLMLQDEGDDINMKPEPPAEDVPVPPLQNKKHPLRKRGYLRGVVDFPVDVLMEIFKHLLPQDILRLSRTTKGLNGILMSKQSHIVWRCAQQNAQEELDFPPLPKGWAEIRWFNLFYSPWCQFCGINPCRKVMWGLQIRICRKCSKKELAERCIGKVPAFKASRPDRVYAVHELIRTEHIKRSKKKYLRSELAKIKMEYREAEGPQLYAQQRRKYLDQIKKQAVICEKWMQTKIASTNFHLSLITNERRQAIRGRLEELGYGREINAISHPYSFKNHPLVNKPRRLTPKLWENMKGPMTEFMDQMRALRLEKEHAAVVEERKLIAAEVLREYKNAHLNIAEHMPGVLDFCRLEPIRTLIQKPGEARVNKSVLSSPEVMAALPAALQGWKDEKTRFIAGNISHMESRARKVGLAVVQRDLPLDPKTYYGGHFPLADHTVIVPRLSLATTAFGCRRCLREVREENSYVHHRNDRDLTPLFYPGALNHQCLSRNLTTYHQWKTAGVPVKPAEMLRKHQAYRITWESKFLLKYDHQASNCAYSLVSAAGLDPDTTTVKDMDDSDLWFVCHCCARYESCSKRRIHSVAYRWRTAIAHHHDQHKTRPYQWTRLTTSEVAVANDAYIRVETEASWRIRILKDVNYMCTHCRDTQLEEGPFERKSAIEHVQTEHKVRQPMFGIDYYRLFEVGNDTPFAYDVSITREQFRNDVVHEPRKTNPFSRQIVQSDSS